MTAATYAPASYELRFVFPGGTFLAYSLRESKGDPESLEPPEAALTWTERWEFQHDGHRLYADMDERALIAGSF